MLESLLLSCDLDLTCMRRIVSAIDDVMELLPQTMMNAVLVHQQVAQMVRCATLLVQHCQHMLTRVDRLSMLSLQAPPSSYIGSTLWIIPRIVFHECIKQQSIWVISCL